MSSFGRAFDFEINFKAEDGERDQNGDDEKFMRDDRFQKKEQLTGGALANGGFCDQRRCADGHTVQQDHERSHGVALLYGGIQSFVVQLLR